MLRCLGVIVIASALAGCSSTTPTVTQRLVITGAHSPTSTSKPVPTKAQFIVQADAIAGRSRRSERLSKLASPP